jgi:ABC-type multidrug transport system ATPase subunit
VIVIGPNGAGKSTLLNCLTGALEPTTGLLTVGDSGATTRFKTIQKYLGVCFQENVLLPLLNVREHFFLFGSFRGVSEEEIEASLEYFAETLQLSEVLKTRAGDLSGGQKRKTCLGLSLLGSPPIVIMDEPTAGVDVQARQLIWKTIAGLTSTTSIVTSHAVEEAEAVSSRLFIVASGHLAFQGTATELREEYKCGYILRVERQGGGLGEVLEFIKKFIPETSASEERGDTILLPVSRQVSAFLREFESERRSLGVLSYSFAVQQLEDMLLKLVMEEEAKVPTV